jgi:hypothetical protein
LQNIFSIELFKVWMKTILSIPLIILIFFSGVSFKFATHYCEGYVAATKVSLTGELATCGMDHPSDYHSLQDTYNNNCCEDFISSYSICNNYVPSSYNVNNPGRQVISMIFAPVNYLDNKELIVNTSENIIKPPGNYYPNCIARPVLCIFRI